MRQIAYGCGGGLVGGVVAVLILLTGGHAIGPAGAFFVGALCGSLGAFGGMYIESLRP